MAISSTDAGEIKYPVEFKQPVSSLNNRGEKEITGYTPTIATKAKVSAFNIRRTTEANATLLLGSLDFTVRWASERETITREWVIGYEGADYTIHEIENDGKFIRFTAKART